MARVIGNHKACTINPLKSSAPLGGALAFLGIDGCLPLLHGAQGCTAFALVQMVRHFREAIPLQTTALNEVTTILGGAPSVEEAVDNIYRRAQPRLIGICSTALAETRGEDMVGDLKLIRPRHPEWHGLELVFASTPDYFGGLAEGWSRAVEAIVETLVAPATGTSVPRQVNLLASSHLTPGDVEDLREIIEGFGLVPIVLPDLSGSLDGHVPDRFIPTTYGGTSVDDIKRMGLSSVTLAIGEQMRPAAEALRRRAAVPYTLFDRVTGLEPTDAFVATLMEVSGSSPPAKLQRQRSQLIDSMLDAHFHFGGKAVAIAAEPDLLFALASLLSEMGSRIVAAVTTAGSASAARVPADTVVVGDLDDLERTIAALGHDGCDLMIAPSHGRQAAERTGVPLWRSGFPIFDRLGVAQRVSVGYRGTRDLIFDLGNLFMEAAPDHRAVYPDPARSRPPVELRNDRHPTTQAALG